MSRKMELQKISEKIDSGYYSQEAITKDLKPQFNAAKTELEKAGHEAILSARALIDQHRAEVKAAERLDPAEIDDGDMKLLNTGLLEESDIEEMLTRHSGNRTMSTLAQRYAKNHGIKISQEVRARLGVEHNAAIAEIEAVNEAVTAFEKWITKPDSVQILNRFFGISDQPGDTE